MGTGRGWSLVPYCSIIKRNIDGREGVRTLVMCVPDRRDSLSLWRGLIIYPTTNTFSPNNLCAKDAKNAPENSGRSVGKRGCWSLVMIFLFVSPASAMSHNLYKRAPTMFSLSSHHCTDSRRDERMNEPTNQPTNQQKDGKPNGWMNKPTLGVWYTSTVK